MCKQNAAYTYNVILFDLKGERGTDITWINFKTNMLTEIIQPQKVT